jgi:Domain of unknown function (DUF5122) beta-propeller
MRHFVAVLLLIICGGVHAEPPARPSIDTDFYCGSVNQCRSPGYSAVFVDRGGSNADILNAIFVLPDQRTLLVGTALGASDSRVVLAMLNPAGRRDLDFAPQGVVQTALAVGSVHDVQRDSSGRIWVLYEPVGSTDVELGRLLPNGNLDTGFSADGRLTLGFGTSVEKAFGRLMLTNDGRAFVAVSVQDSDSSWRPGFARITSSGALDATFNSTGTMIVTPARSERWTASTLHALNRTRDFAVATFAENGSSSGDESMLIVRFENIAGGNASAGLAFFNAGAIGNCSTGTPVLGSTQLSDAVVRPNGDLVGVGTFKPSGGSFSLLLLRLPLVGAPSVNCAAVGGDYATGFQVAMVNPDSFAILSYLNNTQTRLDYVHLVGTTFTIFVGSPHQAPRSWPNSSGADAPLAISDIAVQGSKIVLGGSRLWSGDFDYDFAVAGYRSEIIFGDSF